MQATMFPLQYGFEVMTCPGGFYLVDRDTFNNWGEIRKANPFPTAADAYLYAFKADEFKRGKRMTMD